VDLSNTKCGRIESVTEYAGEDAPSRAQRVLRPGDTIIGTVRPGNRSYALVSKDGLTGSTGFAVLRPRTRGDRAFVYLATTAPKSIDGLAHLADGAAYPAVRPDVVVSQPVLDPGAALLRAFSDHAKPLLNGMATHEHESAALAAMRDSLLPKLVSGELRLDNRDRFVEADVS
jgi:type I restriction enzyme S subunit